MDESTPTVHRCPATPDSVTNADSVKIPGNFQCYVADVAGSRLRSATCVDGRVDSWLCQSCSYERAAGRAWPKRREFFVP